jgi:hypothetical protein
MLQIRLEFAAVVQVPEADVAQGKNHTRAGRSFGCSAERSAFASPGNGYCAATFAGSGRLFHSLVSTVRR